MKKVFISGLLAMSLLSTLGLMSYAEEVKPVYGDADGDNKITSADSLYVLRTSVGIEKPADDVKIASDVDNDGNITSADALEILRYSVGLKTDGKTGKTITADNKPGNVPVPKGEPEPTPESVVNSGAPEYGTVVTESQGGWTYIYQHYSEYEKDFYAFYAKYQWENNKWNLTVYNDLRNDKERLNCFFDVTRRYFKEPNRSGQYEGEYIESELYFVYLP